MMHAGNFAETLIKLTRLVLSKLADSVDSESAKVLHSRGTNRNQVCKLTGFRHHGQAFPSVRLERLLVENPLAIELV
jgi:hypothetical protein